MFTEKLDPGIPRVGFSYIFPPGRKIRHFSTSDSDSSWKTVYIYIYIYIYIGYTGILRWNLFPVLGHLTARELPWALYLARCACLTAVQSHSDSLLNKCPDPGGVREEAGPPRSLPFPVSYICRYSCTLKSSLLERRKPYVSPNVSIMDCPPSFLFLPPIKTCESLVICC